MKRLIYSVSVLAVIYLSIYFINTRPVRYAFVPDGDYDPVDRMAVTQADGDSGDYVAKTNCEALIMWHDKAFPQSPNKYHCERL